MNIYAVLPLVSFVAYLFFGAFVFFKAPRARLNQLYLALCIALAFYAFVDFGYRNAQGVAQAQFFWNLDFTWPIQFALFVHFVLVFSEKHRWLAFWGMPGLLYVPALFFCGADFFGHLVTGPPVERYWGWTYGIRETWWADAAYTWMVGSLLVSMGVLIRYRMGVALDGDKRRVNAVIGAASVLVVAFLVEYIIRLFGFVLQPVVTPSYVVSGALIGLAMWRYDLFEMTPARAAATIIDTMGDGLMIVGLDERINSVNRAMIKLVGGTAEDLIGRNVRSVFAPDAPLPEWLNYVPSQQPDTFHSRDLESAYLCVDGRVLPVSVSGSMLYDHDRNLRGFLFIARDITERKQAADELARYREHLEEEVQKRTYQLQRSNEQLQREIRERRAAEEENRKLSEQLYIAQKMEAIGRLAGGVAHDFNNLLFVINGYCESLLLDCPEMNSVRADVVQIQKAAQRASTLTKQLLAFSRRQVVEPVVLDLNDRVSQAEPMLSRLVGEDVTLRMELNEELDCIVMDAAQLDQILANLVVNARDAIPQGGEILISTTSRRLTAEEAASSCAEASAGDYVVLTVRDNGEGMDEATRKRVFEPFFTTKPVGKGTGLGLATVYGIMKQHRGFVEINSVVGVGTEFHLFFPQSGQTSLHATQTWDDTPVRRGSETVLLVEDNHMVRQLARRQLEANGYHVLEAVDGENGLSAFEQDKDKIDVVLSDVVMPAMSGPQMVERIRQQRQEMKVLFMSGHNDDIIDRHGINQSGFALITKPFSQAELCDKLREVLDNRPSRPPKPAVMM